MHQFHPTIQWCTEYRNLQVIGLAFGKTGKYKPMEHKACTFVEAVVRIQQLTGKKFSVDSWMFYVEDNGTYKVLSPAYPEGRFRITLQSLLS